MLKYGESSFKEWMPALSFNGFRAARAVFRTAAAIEANRGVSPAAAIVEPAHEQLPTPARQKGVSLSHVFSPLPLFFGCLRLDCSGLVSGNLGSFCLIMQPFLVIPGLIQQIRS